MTNLREEVAHAIWEACNGPWDLLSQAGKEACFAEAEAAIAVMRRREDAFMKVALTAKEFIDDWRKGDFALSTLAALDAQSLDEALTKLSVELAARVTE